MQNQNNTQAKVLDSLHGLSQKLNPLAQRVSKHLTTVRQWGQEKIGVAQDITELPHDYIHLEKRIDALYRLHNAMLRVTKTHQNPSYDYPAHLQESLVDFSRNVSDRVLFTASSGSKEGGEGAQGAESPVTETNAQNGVPKTLSHALARACAEGAVGIGMEEPLGAALYKYSTVQERIGDVRLKMDQEITNTFYAPFNATLNNTLAQATKARRNVQSLRLQLDASKASYRSAKPEKADAARLEVERNEDQFVAAVEEATTIMRSVLESPEPLKNISDLVAAQLAYYKEAHELLAELAPEIDEMQVTQEALYRNARNE